MKILFISNLYTPYVVGGAEITVQILAESFVKAGHRPVVITLTPERFSRIEEHNGVSVYYVSLKNLYWPFGPDKQSAFLKPAWHMLDIHNRAVAAEVGRILDLEWPDVVHTHNLCGFSVAVWREAGLRTRPLVHTLHDHYLLCPRATMFHRSRICAARCTECGLYSLLKQRYVHYVKAIIGVSRYILTKHQEYGFFARTPTQLVIPNPYEVKLGGTPSARTDTTRLRLGYLGSLYPAKGIERLLTTAASLPEDAVEVWVGGKGVADYEASLRQRFPQPNIRFFGLVSPEEFLPQVDMLVVPSLLQDNAPRTILEAYAHGVPVIASRRGGIPEYVDHGITGFVFDPDQTDSLLDIARTVIANPALLDPMQLAALEKAQTFVPRRIVQAHLDIYQSSVGKGG